MSNQYPILRALVPTALQLRPVVRPGRKFRLDTIQQIARLVLAPIRLKASRFKAANHQSLIKRKNRSGPRATKLYVCKDMIGVLEYLRNCYSRVKRIKRVCSLPGPAGRFINSLFANACLNLSIGGR